MQAPTPFASLVEQAPTSSAVARVDALTARYSSTLRAIGNLARWHADAVAFGGARYVNSAPPALRDALKAEIEGYEAEIKALEQTVLQAKAVVERDGRKARGEPPLMPKPAIEPVAEPAKVEDSGDAPMTDAVDLEALFDADLFGTSSIDAAGAASAGNGSSEVVHADTVAFLSGMALPFTSSFDEGSANDANKDQQDFAALLSQFAS